MIAFSLIPWNIKCAGELQSSEERAVPDERLLASWNPLGGNQQRTTLNKQWQSRFPHNLSPFGGNLLLRHQESPSGRSSPWGNQQSNYPPRQQGWQAAASLGNHGGSPSNIAKQEKVEDPNFPRPQGKLGNRSIFEEKPAIVTPGKVGSPSYENSGGGVGATGVNLRESEKVKNLRQHLLILLHAHKCQRKLESGLLDECKVPFCSTMRGVLEHMKICRVVGQWQCPVPHCTTSCKILAHWKSCKKQSCHVCAPLKQPNMSSPATMSPSTSPGQTDRRFGGSPVLQQHQDTHVLQQHQQLSMVARQVSRANPGEKSLLKAWQNSISSELRGHLLEKMFLVLKTPSNQSQTQKSPQNWLMVAKEVELETHLEAGSSEEYFQLMSEKTAMMSRGKWNYGNSPSIGHFDAGSESMRGETREDTEAAVENIPSGNALRVVNSPNEEKGNFDNHLVTERQAVARKEPRGMLGSPSATHSSEGGSPEAKSKVEAGTGSSGTKSKVLFSATDLRTALLPPLEKLYSQEPESEPFRSPVDPVALGIEGYFDVVKKPMDLSRIRRKLEVGSYQDPWQFIGDVYLMLENAWLYNKKNSRVYKFTSKVNHSGQYLCTIHISCHPLQLADIFEEEIDPVMRNMGFCCGRKLHYNPQVKN